jgi:hypothetical protein
MFGELMSRIYSGVYSIVVRWRDRWRLAALRNLTGPIAC